MNGNPKDLETINSLARRTDLPVDISQLELLGEKRYQDFIVKNFKKPKISLLKKSGYSLKWLPTSVAKHVMKMSIKINKNKCTLCEQCVKHCPASAMRRVGNKIVVDDEKCIECYCCGEGCPNDAIVAKWNLFRIIPYMIIFSIVGISLIIWLILFLFL